MEIKNYNQIQAAERFLQRVDKSLNGSRLELMQNRSINRFLNRHNKSKA